MKRRATKYAWLMMPVVFTACLLSAWMQKTQGEKQRIFGKLSRCRRLYSASMRTPIAINRTTRRKKCR